ncbi:DUF397 domain-containing protein [Streptomyces sp. NBC_00006]|uniref:DUF397 domain-containing protein n=1 Tax=Streptomyces sp. NBC_00006 TaxID=2975619 RepID=UPI0022561D30|nr:DUF397 domain-containing protein [Streptomyces sp. NBC_00006]MCX5529776.1 DUF397 domain-containing protein [Streptomyces sp. NBC_00006]
MNAVNVPQVYAELNWRKSSYSSGEGGECLEIAHTPTDTYIRDSKSPTGPVLSLTARAWSDFIAYASR